MYNKNNLMRNVLITVEEVMFHAPTDQEVDKRMIEQSIIIAEERFIRPELGTALYDYLVDTKNQEVTTANKAALQALFQNSSSEITVTEGDLVNAMEFLTNPNYLKLWKQHLWKLTAECVITAAYPEGFVRFSSAGTFHNSPPAGLMVTSGQVVPLLSSMKWAVDKKVKDRIGPLIDSMHNYLCKYKGNYSQYTRECPCEDDPTTTKTKHSGLAMGLYDEEDDGCECKKSTGWC